MREDKPDIINGRPGKLPPQRPPETRADRDHDTNVLLWAGLIILVIAWLGLKAAAVVYS